jgi:hypothetical protein
LAAKKDAMLPLPPEGRYQIIIVDRERQIRYPRSKKRRIRRKWRKSRKNWGPLMVPVGNVLVAGALSGVSEAACAAMKRRMEMSPALWEKVQREAPEFAALCDVLDGKELARSLWTEAFNLACKL